MCNRRVVIRLGESGNRDAAGGKSDDFLDFGGAQAAGADFNFEDPAFFCDADGAQVGLPGPARFAVRVAHGVAGCGAFPADVTYIRHC